MTKLLRGALSLAITVAAIGCVEETGPMEPVADEDTSSVVHDPLSMPADPTLDPAAFTSAQECAACHPTHAKQWSTSNHAYALEDPLFRRLVEIRHVDLEGTQDQFCTSCHSAIGTRGGECVEGFSFADLSPITLEGVTCEACHRVQSLQRPFNSGHVLDPTAPIGGPIQDPMESGFHASRYDPLFESAELCAGCHDVVETNGLQLERPYQEWLESPAKVQGRPCQSCHMPSSMGQAAVGGPEREIHSHLFASVTLPLLDGFIPDEETRTLRDQASDALLKGAAEVELTLPGAVGAGAQLDVVVTVRNLIDAHALPTGTTFLRQMWLEVTATDAEGRVLYRTGHLDDAGDLRDIWSSLDPFGDPDLITLTSQLVDARGNPTPFPWLAANHFTNAIPPAYERTWTLFIPVPEDAAGPVSVAARLRFRSVAPWLLRAVGLEQYVDRLVIKDMAQDSGDVPLQ